MRAPKSWIAEYVDLPANLSDQEIADGLVRVGFEVEEIIFEGKDLTGPLVVGKVLAIEELKEHKKPIRYVELDCGEGQTRFVICGAQNFKQGDTVALAQIGYPAAYVTRLPDNPLGILDVPPEILAVTSLLGPVALVGGMAIAIAAIAR